MRHLRKKNNNLNRLTDQRNALFRSLAREIILHKQIQTTLSKAKAIRPYFEKLITKAKKSIQEQEPVKKLHYIRLIRKELSAELLKPLLEISQPLISRQGGYLRILKTTKRLGDNTEMALIQVLDN